MKLLFKRIDDKENFAFFTDSLSEIRKLSQGLDSSEYCIISSDTSPTDRIKNVIGDLNNLSKDYRAFLYTPSFSTGNDLNDNRIKEVFGLITSNTLTVNDIFQGLNRARQAKTFNIYLNPRRDYFETSHEKIEKEYYDKAQNINDGFSDFKYDSNGNRVLDENGHPVLEIVHSDYLSLKAKIEAAKNLDKSDMKGIFLKRAIEKGFVINEVEKVDKKCIEGTKQRIEFLSEKMLQDKIDSITKANLITQEKYDIISKKYSIDAIDRAEIEKFEYNKLGVDTAGLDLEITIRAFSAPDKLKAALQNRFISDPSIDFQDVLKRDIEKNKNIWFADSQSDSQKRLLIQYIESNTGILDFVRNNKFNKDSLEIEDFQNFMYENRNDVKRHLNITANLNPKARMILVRNFLSLFGIKLVCRKIIDTRFYAMDRQVEKVVLNCYRHFEQINIQENKCEVSMRTPNIVYPKKTGLFWSDRLVA